MSDNGKPTLAFWLVVVLTVMAFVAVAGVALLFWLDSTGAAPFVYEVF